MLLHRVFRTSAFRLAVQAAGLSLLSAVIIFVIIYQASEVTVRDALDLTARSEQADVLADAAGGAETMKKAVQDEIPASPGTFWALGAADGTLQAGNLPMPRAFLRGLRGWRMITAADGVALPPHVRAVRGVALTLADGSVLFVGENADALIAMDRLITHAFVAIVGITVLIGLAGGLLVARSSLRRVEAISDASREIMAGDLSRRVAVTGNHDEFDHLAVSLNAMLARIQALMEDLKQVTNDIAHDLRSPLARLRERLELAQLQSEDPAMQAAFDDALGQVDDCLRIFAAMLRIAEIEAGARRRGFSQVDISAMLAGLAETFETVAESHDRMFSAEVPDGLTLDGDVELLTQMVVNVIENAIQHTPPGASIMLRAARTPRSLEITLADDGPGVPAQDRARVLQRFVRLDTARQHAGSGLGLSLVHAVAVLHDGEVELLNNGPGLRVVIYFPRPVRA